MPDPFGAPDAVDEVLSRRAPAAEDPSLRRAVREQTSGMVRRRGRIRRLCTLASWLTFFLAGAGSMHLWQRLATSSIEPREQVSGREASLDNQRPPTPVAKPGEDRLSPALAQEWQALDARENGKELYLQAGRRYLEEDQDYTAALRCYTRALDGGDLTVSAEDDWLLLALKNARRKEKNDAQVDH